MLGLIPCRILGIRRRHHLAQCTDERRHVVHKYIEVALELRLRVGAPQHADRLHAGGASGLAIPGRVAHVDARGRNDAELLAAHEQPVRCRLGRRHLVRPQRAPEEGHALARHLI